jgi:hypothetical protein
MKTYTFLLALCLLLSCSTPAKKEKQENNLPFEVTGSVDALPHFDKGLLLLHNFEYDDAAEAFIKAQQTDSTFAMAYWGEAMTYNHPVWGDVDVEKARATLSKLGSTTEEREAKTKTDLEKDFIKAVSILYGEGSKPDRDKEYAAAMEKVYERYPGNHEAAAFYALSLLGAKESLTLWEDQNIKGAEIAEAILKENPSHPGALHYLIHSDDHPAHAQKALAAADTYAKVASYAGHALHMPSHIYLALGMWDNVVSSNEVAWKASLDRQERKKLDNNHLSYHAHMWLQYGYLQQGRFDRAKELI